MKKILTLAMAVMFPIVCVAASSVPKTNTATVDVDKVTGNYNSFRWVWPGYSAQSCTLTFMQGSSYIDLTGYTGNFKVVKKTNAGQTAYISLTGTDVTISGSNATFSVLYTNIPPDGEYMAEFWAYLTATPATARTLAQGKIVAIDSIYAHDDSSYPWPSNQSTLANYVLLTDDNYEAALTNVTGDTEFVVTGSGRSRVGAIASTLTRDTELVAATQAIAVAYAAADVTALGIATNSFAPISVTISAASNAAMAGATATFLPLAGGTLTGNVVGTTGEFYRVKGAVAPAAIMDFTSAVNIYPADDGFSGGDFKLYSRGIDYATIEALKVSFGASAVVTVTSNLVVGGTITEGGSPLASKYSARTWDIDATIAATNQPSWSLCRKAARSSNVSITSVNAQSYYGTGTWMICQGASPSSWATSGTYTASTTGDTTAVSITWTAGNNLYFVLLPLQCSDYPTNTIFPHAEGTY